VTSCISELFDTANYASVIYAQYAAESASRQRY